MLISSAECWVSAKTKHNLYFDKMVMAQLSENRSNLTVELCKFLIDNHSLIRDGNEYDFRSLQIEYQRILESTPEEDHEKIDLTIKKIFDYSFFSVKRIKRWNAYSLCNYSTLKTCPYCNLSYEVTVFEEDGGEIRPALDHFFDKATYPLFAISLGNLIPSCHHCNSTCKGSIDFVTQNHLNPLTDKECIKILLDVPAISARIDLRVLDKAKVDLVFDKNDLRQANSIKTFKIKKRYSELIGEIRDIAKNMVEYSTSGVDNSSHLRWVLRNVDTENYRDRIFGKMILDLSSIYL